ncbi:similar to Saccharomyces cerevisiae YPL065W VPS28 Component of the ESCRT-I complex [Geotrichum candidum]|uniref:Vacuolar protein sorting-associated protein 28 n=1 Tax=Geotrichum candidum TaxID=1173061 RepID=A0A0J9XH56_GEOCN|nr:similar to Saccharomyces cerevisiae YPL065W VPS28 Component of the ESCRT-I complex [Geotrichum candidum]
MSNSVIPPPYAPTSSASYTGARAGASAHLDTEIKLVTSTKEREHYDSLAEIYAVLTSLEFLERAYLRDSILHTEYTPTCLRLLAQYNGIVGSNPALLGDAGIEGFRDRYGVSATHAISRLKIGVPATVEHAIMESGGSGSGGAGGAGGANGSGGMGASARAVAEATGNFITCMDALRLNYKAKDQLHPLLSELMTSLNKVTKKDFEGRGKIVQWLITLNALKINEEINEEQARQMLFDLDNAYKVFYTNLE